MKNFAKEIKAYKEEKKLDEVNLPEVFCFLTNLELFRYSFDDAFSFLAKFFKLTSLKNILNNYGLISLV